MTAPVTWAPGWWLTPEYIIDRRLEAIKRGAYHKPQVARCLVCGDWKAVKNQCKTCATVRRTQRTPRTGVRKKLLQ